MVYRAAAGSGKTFALVRQYLRITLGDKRPNYFKKILALTFTNKAADEMRDRILTTLLEISTDSGSETMTEKLVVDLQVSAEVVREKAGVVRNHIIHNYSDFSIMTIDKFVNRIVKSFALDLSLESDYRIELDQDAIIENAVDQLIQKVGVDKEITKVLREFVLERVNEESDWQIRFQLTSFGKLIFKEQLIPYFDIFQDYPIKGFLEARDKLKARNSSIEQYWLNRLSKALEAIESSGEAQNAIKATDLNFVKKFVKGKGRFVEKDFTESRKSNYAAGDLEKKQASEVQKSDYSKVKDVFESALRDVVGFAQGEEFGRYKLSREILKNLYQLATIQAIRQEVKTYQEEFNVYTFSDLNQKIASIVQDNPAPFIFERLGEKYTHFLIDEFQDTSVIQWRNLLPLIEDSLAKNNYNLLVGDGKQAIYRWRNGDVKQFHALPRFKEPPRTTDEKIREDLLVHHYKGIPLENNYRSAKNIVEFNNRLFNRLKDSLAKEKADIFSNIHQNPIKEFEGYVQAIPLEYLDSQSLIESRVNAIDGLVKESFQAGYSSDDIAVLCRTNAIASNVAQGLIQKGYNIETSDSLKLNRNFAVQGILAFFQILNNDKSTEASLIFVQLLAHTNPDIDLCLTLETYTDLNNGNGSFFRIHDFLEKHFPEIMIDDLRSQGIYEIAEQVIDVFKFNESSPAYCLEFLQKVQDFTSIDSGGLSRFLEWWQSSGNKFSLNTSGAGDSIKVYTIHKSKGLEFPVIILPIDNHDSHRMKGELPVFLNIEKFDLPTAVLNPTAALEGTDVDPQRMDELESVKLDSLNTLYVGCTRAVSSLKLILEYKSSRNFSLKPNYVSHNVMMALNELESLELPSQKWSVGVESREGNSEEAFEQVEMLDNLDFFPSTTESVLNLEGNPNELDDELSKTRYGDLFHQLMSRIHTYSDFEKIKTEVFPWQKNE